MLSDLVTISDFCAATGRNEASLDETELTRIQWAITSASSSVRAFLDRDVTLQADATPGPRTFRYWGNGSLDVDDFTTINSVSLQPTAWSGATRILQPFEYLAMSNNRNLPILDTIEIWTLLPMSESPAMGFQWNADTYGYRPQPIILTVDAQWGWPEIPTDIKQATIWTMGEVLIPETPYIQEAIANYSVTLERSSRSGGGQDGGGGQSPASMENVVPGRAQAVLSQYARVNV